MDSRYFPKGGGLCKINVKPVRHLKPIDLTNAGEVQSFFGWSFVSGTLPLKVRGQMESMADLLVSETNLFAIHSWLTRWSTVPKMDSGP